MKGLGKDQGLELLKLNSIAIIARFGIVESEEELMVVASVDAILDSLDADEVEAYFWYIAMAAARK